MTEAKLDRIQPGIYRHFKGKQYHVIGEATHSETMEPMVVYRALYGEYKLWIRSSAMFRETVQVEGREVPRFVLEIKLDY